MTFAKSTGAAALLSAIVLAGTASPRAEADGGATPEEVVEKVNQAAEDLAKEGEAGLSRFEGPDSPYVWKDSYVVVASCSQDETIVHPIQPDLDGTSIKALTDEHGEPFGEELCEQAAKPEGGWVEYMWPKPGDETPSRKVSYVRTVEGTPYVVLAGVYEDDASLEDLERISAQQR